MMDGLFIAVCIILAIFLIWFWGRQRKLSAMLKFGCVICAIVCTANGQEDTDFITEVRPLVFPEPMMQAEAAIGDLFGNESDHMLFLSDDYWPIWFNNSTIA